jgi:dTMP kinase
MAENQAQTGASMLRPERPLLIALEGIDLSGRTTQVELLRDWLTAGRYHVTTTAWRTSPLISDVLTRARLGPPLRPLTYSLLYCADHMDRTQQVIKPAQQRGEIVLADRYIYTAFARDTARGLDPAWVRDLYRFSMKPDAVFYLHISPEEAVKRRLAMQRQHMEKAEKSGGKSGKGKDGKRSDKGKRRMVGAGLAPALAPSRLNPALASYKGGSGIPALSPTAPILTGEALESYRNFESRMYIEYQNMQKEFEFSVIEGNQSIEQVQATLRRAITRLMLHNNG